MKTAIILAGGNSARFGGDKGLKLLAGKPLVSHVLNRVKGIVDEVIVVVNTTNQKEKFSRVLPEIKAFEDIMDSHCSLVGALTGFSKSSGDYSVLLPCDTPFVSRDIIKLLFDMSSKVDAVIPRWPNGYIEPLHAVYRTSSALSAAKSAIEKGETRMQSLVHLLGRVRYLSTLFVRELENDLATFFNVNTTIDLKKAEDLMRRKAQHGIPTRGKGISLLDE